MASVKEGNQDSLHQVPGTPETNQAPKRESTHILQEVLTCIIS